MKFSVIIPTYNRTRLLMDRAIPSVLRQTNQDWECLVIGDGTEAETDREMAELCLTDSRFRYWNLPRQEYPEDQEKRWYVLGMNALNWGLDHAEGEWIAVLGDDDEWTDDHLAILYEVAQTTGCDHVYGMSMTFKYGMPTGQVYGAWPPGMGQFCDGSNIYRRSLGYRYDPECITRNLPEDGDLWTRMLTDGVKFAFIQKIVHHYHRNYP